MDMFAEILDCCTPSERAQLAPSLRGARYHLACQPAHNPYAQILEQSKRDTERRRANAGWYDERVHGRIAFHEAPAYGKRSQDYQVSEDLLAKDRRAEKKEAQRKRQAQYNAWRRKHKNNWRDTLTRRLKSS